MTYAITNKDFRSIKIFCKDQDEFKAYCKVFEKYIERGDVRENE